MTKKYTEEEKKIIDKYLNHWIDIVGSTMYHATVNQEAFHKRTEEVVKKSVDKDFASFASEEAERIYNFLNFLKLRLNQ